ncbi:MAG: hypothetical protein R2941_14940 [Desulfobacterales bacterium]
MIVTINAIAQNQTKSDTVCTRQRETGTALMLGAACGFIVGLFDLAGTGNDLYYHRKQHSAVNLCGLPFRLSIPATAARTET